MKLLLVSKLDRSARAINTIANYVRAGTALGHDVVVFGEKNHDDRALPTSLNVKEFDFAIFVVYMPWDFPDLPYLAQLLDGMPKERRVIIDCCGRYNDTIRVEHDFNHLEKVDQHQGWEWLEGFRAVSDRILQPTRRPLRDDVQPFLFHGYDPGSIVRPYGSTRQAADSWSTQNGRRKPYGVTYVGTNWQRWSQMRRLLEALEPLREELGAIRLIGWDWDKRPDWAVQLGIQGVDVDPVLLGRLGVETRAAVTYDQVRESMSQALFTPVIQRPLFNHLGLVTNRVFETFCADTLPLLFLPEELIESVYGATARQLAITDDVAPRIRDMLRQPEKYWEAVLHVRRHLAQHHSYERRFEELLAILEG
jgi:hypothetical protein